MSTDASVVTEEITTTTVRKVLKGGGGGGSSRSQIVAMAERAAELGAVKAVLCYLDEDGNFVTTSTEKTTVQDLVFMLRQAEYAIFVPPHIEEAMSIEEEEEYD